MASLNLIAVLRGTERVEVFGRELSHDSIRRSNAAVVVSLGILFVFIFILSILEPKMSIMTLTFECVSALSTVGSSLNATPLLCDESKLLVSLLMFIGRSGTSGIKESLCPLISNRHTGKRMIPLKNCNGHRAENKQ